MMKIYHLPEGTKLVWDAPPLEAGASRITYPVRIGSRETMQRWRKVHVPHGSPQWMGDPVTYLREPTGEELRTMIWPEIPSA